MGWRFARTCQLCCAHYRATGMKLRYLREGEKSTQVRGKMEVRGAQSLHQLPVLVQHRLQTLALAEKACV